MPYTYKIESLAGDIDITVCPPPIVKHIFPSFNGQTCHNQNGYCLVTFDSQQTPVDLGPLVIVELVEQPSS